MTREERLEKEINSKNICDSCINYSCIFQSGIIRKHCAFYIPRREENRMNRELAELTVKSLDYDDKVVTALQNAGFVIVLRAEAIGEKYYIVAEKEGRE